MGCRIAHQSSWAQYFKHTLFIFICHEWSVKHKFPELDICSCLSLMCCHTAILVLNLFFSPSRHTDQKAPLSFRESEQGAGRAVGSGGPRGDGLEQPKWTGGILAGGEGHTAGKAGGCWEETGKSESHWQSEGSPAPGKGLNCVQQRLCSDEPILIWWLTVQCKYREHVNVVESVSVSLWRRSIFATRWGRSLSSIGRRCRKP